MDMINIIDIFTPYIPFISFFVTLIVNTTLILRGVQWYNIIIANVLISLTFNILGFESYDLLTQLFNVIIDFFTNLFSAIGDFFKGIFNPFS